MGNLALVLLAIWLSAMLLFFAVSVRLSALAARPMEEAVQREKQFIADASHDLKTPLSVILANNAILLENPEAPVGSVRRWVDSSQESAKRMQQLISQMLTLADVERPDTALSTQPVDLAAIAMKAALEMESIAYEKCVTLETALPEACSLRGNTDYLQRIVSSLLENALKYEPAGGRVQLTLTQDKRREPEKRIRQLRPRPCHHKGNGREAGRGNFRVQFCGGRHRVSGHPLPVDSRKGAFAYAKAPLLCGGGGWTVSAVPWWGRPSYTRSRGCTPFRFFVCGIPC